VSTLEQIAYDAALRRLDKQDALLSDIRSRMGVLVGAASVAASLSGGAILGRPAPLVITSSALVGFVTTVATSVFVLLPNRRLAFSLRGSGVFETLYGLRGDAEETYRRLTYELECLWLDNDVLMQSVLRAYRVGSAALTLEVISLLLLPTGTIG
jgi:hypothetical protein